MHCYNCSEGRPAQLPLLCNSKQVGSLHITERMQGGQARCSRPHHFAKEAEDVDKAALAHS